jgi:hypothetical protein
MKGISSKVSSGAEVQPAKTKSDAVARAAVLTREDFIKTVFCICPNLLLRF